MTSGAGHTPAMVNSGTEGVWIWETYRAEDVRWRRDLPMGRRALAEMSGEVTTDAVQKCMCTAPVKKEHTNPRRPSDPGRREVD